MRSRSEITDKVCPVWLLGDTDDIIMSMNFFDETDDDKSDSSQRQAYPAIPPLPSCLPPPSSTLGGMESSNSSYYLPSPRRDDDTASADEASEIANDDTACGIIVEKAFCKLSGSSKARSMDRDSRSVDRDSRSVDHESRSVDHESRSVDHESSSVDHDSLSMDCNPRSVDHDYDYSQGGQLVFGGRGGSQRRSNTKLSTSLDSIPDSGLSTLHQETDCQGVKAMIADFERQIKVSGCVS